MRALILRAWRYRPMLIWGSAAEVVRKLRVQVQRAKSEIELTRALLRGMRDRSK